MILISAVNIVHVISVVTAIAGITIQDYLVMRALHNGQYGTSFTQLAPLLSQLIWASYGVLIVSGVLFLVIDQQHLLTSPWFQTKLLLVFFVGILGIFANEIAVPDMLALRPSDWQERTPGLRRAVLGALPYTITTSLLWYATLLISESGRQYAFTLVQVVLFLIVITAIGVLTCRSLLAAFFDHNK